MDYNINRFETEVHSSIWNNFILEAPNANFLFHRDYLDYHKSRFSDHSLLIYSEKDKLLACFPANQTENVIHSHQGLTYGGLICKSSIKLNQVLSIFKSVLRYFQKSGVEKVVYKSYPRFYNPFQTDEIDYALFELGAKLTRRNTAFVIDRQSKILYKDNIRRAAKKATKAGFKAQESEDIGRYWREILNPHLYAKFDTTAVHSIEEMQLLKNRFPENIKLQVVLDSAGNWQAGTLLYISMHVIHCQYIAYKQEAGKNGSLELLFTQLIDNYLSEKRFFDLGTANAIDSSQLNEGLVAWKERMGGRTYSHDFYEINV